MKISSSFFLLFSLWIGFSGTVYSETVIGINRLSVAPSGDTEVFENFDAALYRTSDGIVTDGSDSLHYFDVHLASDVEGLQALASFSETVPGNPPVFVDTVNDILFLRAELAQSPECDNGKCFLGILDVPGRGAIVNEPPIPSSSSFSQYFTESHDFTSAVISIDLDSTLSSPNVFVSVLIQDNKNNEALSPIFDSSTASNGFFVIDPENPSSGFEIEYSDDMNSKPFNITQIVSIGFSFYVGDEPVSQQVAIDIKPGSNPNCFNINGNGIIPVAILGSNSFNVENIELSSLYFAGLEVRVRGNKGPLCHQEDSDGDGILDLLCQFQDDASVWNPDSDAEATLVGELMDGTPFEGTDSICVVP